MVYKPQGQAKEILAEAYKWIQSVEYRVTARWVFYRLLQSGIYNKKSGYKHLLGITSKARKNFYGPWRPWTLADDTRAPILMQRDGYYTLLCRGWGFKDEIEWINTLKKEINCPLDRWKEQPIYAEIWFEAAAMQGQFLHYANENIPLLAFRGDVSIAEKWHSAERLADRILSHKKPAHIYYYGDLDRKGLTIPKSAWKDIKIWIEILTAQKDPYGEAIPFYFHRVGINQDQINTLNIPENPERPGTYQWEGLDDEQAADFINAANEMINFDAFKEVKEKEREILKRFKYKLME